MRRTVVVTFDYTALALLELLRRQLERTISGDTARPVIAAALMVNGGLFADAHTHPWRTTPVLRTPLGALGMQRAQRSPRVFATTMTQARMYSRGYRPAPAELAELAVGDHPPGTGRRSSHNCRGIRQRAPPPRAALGSGRYRP